MQREERKAEHKQISKEQREAKQQRQFNLKQQKRKETQRPLTRKMYFSEVTWTKYYRVYGLGGAFDGDGYGLYAEDASSYQGF